MATVTVPICGFGGNVEISLVYDDGTGILTGVSWSNNSGKTFTVTLTRPDGKTFTGTLPVGSGTIATPGQSTRRFSFARGSADVSGGSTEWAPDFKIDVGG